MKLLDSTLREARGTACGAFVLSASMLLCAMPGCATAEFPPPARPEVAVSDSAVPIAAHNPQLGDPLAPVTVVAFVGFQSAACARQGTGLDALRASFGAARVRMVFRFAEGKEAGARKLAEAAQAVYAQAGASAFLAFGNALWDASRDARRVDAPGEGDLANLAARAGVVDLPAFQAALAQGKYASLVAEDMAVAQRLGVTGCPWLYINGREMSPRTAFVEPDVWRGQIEREEKHAESLIASGTKRGDLYATLVKENMSAASQEEEAQTQTPGATRTLLGGLQLTDVALGRGIGVKAGDTIRVHYTGRLADGSVFDSSVGSAPFEFVVGRGKVIRGWDVGLIGLKPGGKRKLVIPPALAYGSRSMGDGKIPANSTLYFDVELLEIR